jgi:hypothetical protein
MGCILAVFAAIVPRVLILVGWYNDQAGWNAVFPSPLFLLLGFILMPWTTFFFALFAPGGITGVQIVILIAAVVADIATYSGAIFGSRGRSSYRDLD